jgi:AraC-like DNA-binding protein
VPIDYTTLQQASARMLAENPFSTQIDLARHLGVSRAWVSRVLIGNQEKSRLIMITWLRGGRGSHRTPMVVIFEYPTSEALEIEGRFSVRRRGGDAKNWCREGTMQYGASPTTCRKRAEGVHC